jgi:hypothetical protein
LDGKQQAIKVELVGADKAFEAQRQFEKLRTLSVSGAAVRSAADPAALTFTFPSVTELDLSRTLIPDWQSAVAITARFPSLSILRLCSMGWDAPPSATAGGGGGGTEADSDAGGGQPAVNAAAPAITAMGGVTELYFNLCPRSFPCGASAPQVALIARVFPNLTELHLGGNGIVTLVGGRGEGVFPPTLQHINLEDNNISDWSEILTLAGLPALERLNISKNAITDMTGLFGEMQDCSHHDSDTVGGCLAPSPFPAPHYPSSPTAVTFSSCFIERPLSGKTAHRCPFLLCFAWSTCKRPPLWLDGRVVNFLFIHHVVTRSMATSRARRQREGAGWLAPTLCGACCAQYFAQQAHVVGVRQ